MVSYCRKESGFTLLELAMVLFIITLILGAVLTPLSTRMEAEERTQTNESLKQIRDSLIGYALVNGHLPCPDCSNSSGSCGSAALTVNDGIEDGVDSGVGVSPRAGNTFDSCATSEGNLPWASLGVDGNDAWDNRFIYRVENVFADDVDGTGCGLPAANVSFEICSSNDADIMIRDAPGGNNIAWNIAAVVISYGKNADDPTNPSSASEIENQDNDTDGSPVIFVQKDYTTGSGTDEFDDLLTWIPANTLIYRMVQAERLP